MFFDVVMKFFFDSHVFLCAFYYSSCGKVQRHYHFAFVFFVLTFGSARFKVVVVIVKNCVLLVPKILELKKIPIVKTDLLSNGGFFPFASTGLDE
jgi:hypothetical protein